MKLENKPRMTWETINRMEDMTWFTHALIFDDLLIVSQKETSCFVWKTEQGLVVIDGIWPDKAVYDAIIEAIKDVGWNPDKISKFVMTHGHVDHTGCGKWLVDNHKAVTYLSKTDDEFWRENPTKPDRPDTWKSFDIDHFIADGDIIDCGDKMIYVYETPGHTPGCLSYIFPVLDNGEQHMAALFGGATPPWNNEDGIQQFLQSVDYFSKAVNAKNVDVMLSNHTVFDNGIEKINYAGKRLAYMPNIYILGLEGCKKFMEVYKNIVE
ncbi:MAG: MBL fold metallo-hydrolase [Lachnospiraceae bacterium]|nr:MBL fold metallo-hydrolase [Lachnospiraceae bacterium]